MRPSLAFRCGLRLLAAAVSAGLAVAYAAVAWSVVSSTRIGPVVAVLDEAGGRGVHAGDVLALPMVLLAAGAFVVAVALVQRSTVPVGVRHRVMR